MESNSKRLYEHYKNSGNVKAAQDILKKYPHFEKKVEEKKEEKPSKKKE